VGGPRGGWWGKHATGEWRLQINAGGQRFRFLREEQITSLTLINGLKCPIERFNGWMVVHSYHRGYPTISFNAIPMD
jgi:hypothetical protein